MINLNNVGTFTICMSEWVGGCLPIYIGTACKAHPVVLLFGAGWIRLREVVIECKRALLYMTTTWHFLLSFVLNSFSSLESSWVISLSGFVLSPVDFMTSLGGGGHQLVQLKLALGRVENPNQVRGRIAELLATDPGSGPPLNVL